MRLKSFVAAAALSLVCVVATADVTRENFLLRTAGDLLALCSVSRDDPNKIAAIHFCHGYVLGLDQYGEVTGRVFRHRLYCPTEEFLKLTRDEAIVMFVAWARKNPQHMNETPIDGVIRWLMETWPCEEPVQKQDSGEKR
jgi:hypothetical protein